MSEQTPHTPWGGAQPPQPDAPTGQSWGPPASAAYGGFGAQSAEPTWGQAQQQGSWQAPDGAWQGGASAPARTGLGVSGRHIALAAVTGVAAYLAAAVASAIVMLLQGLALDNKAGFGNFMASIPTWIAGSFGNSRILSYSMGDNTRSASWGAVGVFVVAMTLLAVLFVGRALLRKAPVGKGAPRLALAAVTSLVFFALMLVLALTVHWSSSQTLGTQSATMSLKAVSALGIIIALVSVGFVAYLAFSLRGDALLPSSVRRAGSQFVEHVLVVGSVVSLVYYFVFSANVGKRGWLSFLEIVPGWGVVTSPTGSVTPFGQTPPATEVDPTVFMGFLNGFNLSVFGAYNRGAGRWESMFAGGAWWLILVCLVMLVVGLLWASLRWRLRSGAVDAAPASWLTLPAIYLVGGLVILVSSITSTPDLRAEDKTVVGFVAPWGFALVLLLGVAVEALSRFVAPAVLRSAGGLRGLLGLGIEADWSAAQPRPAAPAGWGSPQAGQPGWGQAPAAQGAWGGQALGGTTAGQAGQDGQPAWGGIPAAAPEQPAWGGGQPTAPAQPAWGTPPAQQGAPVPPAQPEAPAQPAWGVPPAQQAPSAPAAQPAQSAWGAPPAQQAPSAPTAQPAQPVWGGGQPAAPAQQGTPVPPAQPEAPAQPAWGVPPAQQAPSAPAAQPAQPAWGTPPAQQGTPVPPAQPEAPAQPAWGAPPAQQAQSGSAGQPAQPAWGGQEASGQHTQWGQPSPGAQPAPAAQPSQDAPAWGQAEEEDQQPPAWGQQPQPGQPGQQPPQTGWRP
ncbi:MAG: hypothetical protein LBE25_12305 [Arthrobacter sp.]|nr:hypothetical protein [Arthrobacter sp.]